MRKAANTFSPEVRGRAVRLVPDTEAQHRSGWQAAMSIAAKIGCTRQTLNDWVEKAEIDSGRRAGHGLSPDPAVPCATCCSMQRWSRHVTRQA